MEEGRKSGGEEGEEEDEAAGAEDSQEEEEEKKRSGGRRYRNTNMIKCFYGFFRKRQVDRGNKFLVLVKISCRRLSGNVRFLRQCL